MNESAEKIHESESAMTGDALPTADANSWRIGPLPGVRQHQSTAQMDDEQGAMSAIENTGGINLGNARRHVESLGASLYPTSHFPTENVCWLLDVCEAWNVERSHSDQLVLPFLEEEFSESPRDVVLSIKPVYSEKILSGRKTVELRRRFPLASAIGALAYIYSTSPVKAIVGSASISNVRKLPLEEIWSEFQSTAFIERDQFEKYFDKLDHGFALVLDHVRAFQRPFPLSELRERFGFEPPQSFLYAKHDLRRALEDDSAILSH